MLSSDYHTHAVKTKKGELQLNNIKSGLRPITKQTNRKEKGTKYNRLELSSNPVFKGLEKLQRYVTGTILCDTKLDT